jgi:pimeloyl-CoA synthetase
MLISGCAAGPVKPDAAALNIPPKAEIIKRAPYVESGAVIVRAKRLTRLEALKKEATRKNNGDSTAVIAGTAAAIAAYTLSDAYFSAKNGHGNPLASLCITAAAAYITTFVAGFIYNLCTGK